MQNKSQQIADELKQLNYAIRQACEQAEAKTQEVNRQLRANATTGQLQDIVLLGPIVHHGSTRDEGAVETAQVGRVALVGTCGIGICWWGLDEYQDAERTGALELEALTHFVAFEECNPWLKSLMLPQIDPLLECFLRELEQRGFMRNIGSDG